MGKNWEVKGSHEGELLSALHLGHPAGLRIVLGADEEVPKYPYLAIRAENLAPLGGGLKERLKEAVDQQYGPGKVGDPSFWWRYVEKAYTGWDQERLLIRLYRKEDEVLEYITGHLSKIAKIVEGCVGTQAPSRPRK